jgi:hypothetical protein
MIADPDAARDQIAALAARAAPDPIAALRAALGTSPISVSPLLSDPDWIKAFRSFATDLLSTGQRVLRIGSIPSYRAIVVDLDWRSCVLFLAFHLYRAVAARHDIVPGHVYRTDKNIFDPYQMACALFRDRAIDVNGPTEAILPVLIEINDGLSRLQSPIPSVPPENNQVAAANLAAPAREDDQAASPSPLESKPPEAPAELLDLVTLNQAAGTATPTKETVALSAENRAIAVALRLAKERKPLRIRDIADEARCSESYLYRCKTLRDFIATAERCGDPLRGSKDRDTRAPDAWRDDD